MLPPLRSQPHIIPSLEHTILFPLSIALLVLFVTYMLIESKQTTLMHTLGTAFVINVLACIVPFRMAYEQQQLLLRQSIDRFGRVVPLIVRDASLACLCRWVSFKNLEPDFGAMIVGGMMSILGALLVILYADSNRDNSQAPATAASSTTKDSGKNKKQSKQAVAKAKQA